MVITKGIQNISGYIIYRYDYKDWAFMMDMTNEDRDNMYESDKFSSLEELLERMKPEALEKIKEEYNADKVWISSISFTGNSEDGETSATISLAENGRSGGHVATKINNEDITNRALLNIGKIKQIVDNTLEHYPIKY